MTWQIDHHHSDDCTFEFFLGKGKFNIGVCNGLGIYVGNSHL